MKALLLTLVTARLGCAAAIVCLALPLSPPLARAMATPGRPALAQFEGRGFNDRAPRDYDNRGDSRDRSERRDMRERDFNGRERPTRYEEPRRGGRLDRPELQERQERRHPAIILSPQGLSPFRRDRDPAQR